MLIPVHIRHAQQNSAPVYTEGYVNPAHVQTVTENLKGEWRIHLRNQVTLPVDERSARRVVEAMGHEGELALASRLTHREGAADGA